MDKEYIEREALLKIPDSEWEVDGIEQTIMKQPAADVAPVVYCSKCLHHNRCMSESIYLSENIENPYCCRGERKDGEV